VINLELPWPPSINEYWKPGKTLAGRSTMYMTPRAKLFRNDSIWLIKSQLRRYEPIPGALSVKIVLTPPRNIGDIDNVIKPIFDALTHARVIGDDKQIKHMEVWIKPAVAPGFVRLSISLLESDIV